MSSHLILSSLSHIMLSYLILYYIIDYYIILYYIIDYYLSYLLLSYLISLRQHLQVTVSVTVGLAPVPIEFWARQVYDPASFLSTLRMTRLGLSTVPPDSLDNPWSVVPEFSVSTLPNPPLVQKTSVGGGVADTVQVRTYWTVPSGTDKEV